MGLLQIGNGEPGVVLECIQGRVPQQVLDMVHVRPASQEFGGARTPERVRGNVNGS